MDVQGVNFKVLSPLKYRCCAKNKDEHFVFVCVQVYVPVHMQRLEENISVVLALNLELGWQPASSSYCPTKHWSCRYIYMILHDKPSFQLK